MTVPTWTTYRTACGRGRITYNAGWSPSQPWASYWNGTAGRHFPNIPAAVRYFKERHNAELTNVTEERHDDLAH
jgi:hypothetical protein